MGLLDVFKRKTKEQPYQEREGADEEEIERSEERRVGNECL